MKKKTAYVSHAGRTGLLVGIIAFVALSFLAGGLVEFSLDVGFFQWIRDFAVYTFSNKLIYKLVASVAIGGLAAFAADMIAYGKAIKQHKVARVRFHQEKDTDHTRIA